MKSAVLLNIQESCFHYYFTSFFKQVAFCNLYPSTCNIYANAVPATRSKQGSKSVRAGCRKRDRDRRVCFGPATPNSFFPRYSTAVFSSTSVDDTCSRKRATLRIMGISGLLPLLKSIQQNKHLSEFSGQTLAVDAYVWLHRGVYTCATELATGKKTHK